MEATAATDRDADNTSPDSGVDLDLKESNSLLLDPSRRLTLLKSLSQDSEYSLDTSLFDAEEFLQDMGFAGTVDPTIPDRFLPSLMQRLSSFPASEMESLHDRIIQSIGCFRRKEGKRRLFRNLSMGKDPRRNFSTHFLGFPSNSYPLLRSNTDPSTFPYEETTSSDSLQSDRLSSNGSRLHSLGSSKEECELPESPIAILVSAASIDQESCSQLQTATEKEPSLDDVVLEDGSSKSEFVNTVEEIQKLTHKISDQDNHGSRDLDNDVYHDLESGAYQDLEDSASHDLDNHASQDLDEGTAYDVDSGLSHDLDSGASHDRNSSVSHDLDGDVSNKLRDVVSQSCIGSDSEKVSSGRDLEVILQEDNHFNEVKVADHLALSKLHNPFVKFANSEIRSKHDYSSLRYNPASGSDKSLPHISTVNDHACELPPLEKDAKSSSAKTPLRRISNAEFSIPKSYRKYELVEKTGESGLLNAVKGSYEDETSQYSSIKETDRGKANAIESVRVTSTNSDASLKDAECSSSTFLPSQNVSRANNHNSCKPKYSRDDSLTNFLSSMLSTNDPSGERSSVDSMNPILGNNCNSDSEIPGSFASSPFISSGSVDTKSKSQLNQIPRRKISPTFAPDKNSKAIDKAPNRKRRVLRRMSSSLQCCDDVNYSDSKEPKIGSFDNNPPQSIPSPELYRKSNVTHENLQSASSCHRVIHPCNSLPAINLCQHCGMHYVEENIGCPEQMSRSCDCRMGCGRKSLYFRKCKRKRNLSCPSPGVSWNGGVWITPRTEMQTLLAAQCNCKTCRYQHAFPKSNRPRSLINPFNLAEGDSWTGTCCNEHFRCNFNQCCTVPRTNGFYSTSSENLVSNIGYFGPFSPTPQPKNNPFVFESNLRDQNRHLCHSNPELRHECCSTVPNHCEKYCQQRPLSDLNEFGLNHLSNKEKFIEEQKPQTSFRQEEQCFDRAFHPDTNHPDSLQINKYPGVKQNVRKPCVSVRSPQRQHSVSVADSEVQTQDWTPDGGAFPFFQQNSCSVPFHRDAVEGKVLPPPTAMSLTEDKRNDYPPSLNVPKVLQKQDVPRNASIANDKPSSTVDASVTKAEDPKAIVEPTYHNNKSEAVLERKIRIFSKFLANLGNLSKSITDTGADRKHKSPRDNDATTSDKRTKNRASKVSCPAARRHSNSSPELGTLLSLLKSMDCVDGDPKSGFTPPNTEACGTKLQKNESPVYENKVLLQTCNDQNLFEPVLYTSSVSLYINGEAKKDIHINRIQNSHISPNDNRLRGVISPVEDRSSRDSSPQMSFKGVSKEIEGLQLSIQKAKEMRICASKELQLLQKLLSVEDENHEVEKEKRLPGVDSNRCMISRTADVHATKFIHYKTSMLCHQDVYKKLADMRKALTDLRENSKKEILQDTSFWKEEIERVKEETRQEWQAKLDRMESRLSSQEEELRRLQGDNENLRRESPVCHQCRTEGGQNGRTDSAFEDDEDYPNHKQPSIPIQSTRQECDRLQQRLLKEEQRADQLNLMLNQKLIELNKIQITLSKQTKEMIELEKSYMQLQCRLRKGTNKPLAPRLCSRSSPFSNKNLYPKPSPPASPQPSNEAF